MLAFFLLSRLSKCLFINAASVVISCYAFINLYFHSKVICHFFVLIFLFIILDLTSTFLILIQSSIGLAVQLEVYRLSLATRREGSRGSYQCI